MSEVYHQTAIQCRLMVHHSVQLQLNRHNSQHPNLKNLYWIRMMRQVKLPNFEIMCDMDLEDATYGLSQEEYMVVKEGPDAFYMQVDGVNHTAEVHKALTWDELPDKYKPECRLLDAAADSEGDAIIEKVGRRMAFGGDVYYFITEKP